MSALSNFILNFNREKLGIIKMKIMYLKFETDDFVFVKFLLCNIRNDGSNFFESNLGSILIFNKRGKTWALKSNFLVFLDK